MPVRNQIDDATAEALLAGRPVPPALDPLTAVLAVYRRIAEQPVRPRGELATQLAAGGFPRTAAPSRPASGKRRRRRMAAEVLAVVGAKLAGMSLAGKALAGVALATAGMGTAGFAGTLPEPAQERFERVVESVTPIRFPDQADQRSEFGEEVSEDARDGGVDGEEISERARQQGKQRRPADLPTAVPEQPGPPGDPGQPSELPTPEQPGPPAELPIEPPTEDHRPISPPGR